MQVSGPYATYRDDVYQKVLCEAFHVQQGYQSLQLCCIRSAVPRFVPRSRLASQSLARKPQGHPEIVTHRMQRERQRERVPYVALIFRFHDSAQTPQFQPLNPKP